MSRAFKPNLELEQAWNDFADDVLSQGIEWYCVSEEHGHYYWCFMLKSGEQRFCTDAPELIQARLGVEEDSRIHDCQLHGDNYWARKHRALFGDAE